MVTCAICLETSTTPCCCVPCGHIFCRKCIEKWRETSLECPDCRCIGQNIQPLYGLPDDEVQNSNNIRTTAETELQHTQLQQDRLHEQDSVRTDPAYLHKKWILFILVTIAANIFIMYDLYSGTGNVAYILNLPFKMIAMLFNGIETAVFAVIDFVIKVLLFPITSFLSLESFLGSLSTSLAELFWLLVYAGIVCFIVWHCTNMHRDLKKRNKRPNFR